MKLSETWELYLADKKVDGFSPKTLKSYRIQVNLLNRYFGDVGIDTLSTQDFRKYLLNATNEGKKPSTIGCRVRFIKSLYRWASDEWYVNVNPAKKLKEPNHQHHI